MYIKSMHITSFGPLKEKDITLTPGLNIFEGPNESGKSSVAMFIKFMLYGLSGRGTDGELAERTKYANWDTGCAAGTMILTGKQREYRIERELYVPVGQLDRDTLRERIVVTDNLTGERLFRDKAPGEAILGMTEQMFCNSVFVRQLGDTSIDGTGMTEAIENILLSGDEGLNSRKAMRILDNERKALLYKNGGGGKIYELQQELRRLESQRDAATEQNGEIIALESAAADSEARIAQRKQMGMQFAKQAEAYDKIQRKVRLDAAITCRDQVRQLEEQLSKFESYGDIREKIQTMERLSDGLSVWETKLRTMRRSQAEIDDSLPPEMTAEEEAETRSQTEQAASAMRSRKSAFTVSLILFILAAVSGCAGFFLRSMDAYLAMGAGIFAGIAAVCGIAAFARSLSKLKKYHTILGGWGVSDIETLEEVINEKIHLSRQRSDPASEYCVWEQEIAKAESGKAEDTQSLRACAALFTEEVPDTDIMTENAVAAAKNLLTEQTQLTEAYHTAAGRLSTFADVLDPAAQEEIMSQAAAALATEAGQLAAGFSREEAEKARRNAGLYRSNVEADQKQQLEREKKLSALRAVSVFPADLAEKISKINEELTALQKRYKGITAAMEALEAAGNNLRAGLLPRIVSESGLLLGMFSGGKYPTVGITRDFSINIITQDKTRELDYLSAGTRDAAYVSLRYALLNVLFPDDPPPAVFDESFSRMDADRLSKILTMLSTAGERGNQSLLFSCRALEGEIVQSLLQNGDGTDQVIRMDDMIQ